MALPTTSLLERNKTSANARNWKTSAIASLSSAVTSRSKNRSTPMRMFSDPAYRAHQRNSLVQANSRPEFTSVRARQTLFLNPFDAPRQAHARHSGVHERDINPKLACSRPNNLFDHIFDGLFILAKEGSQGAHSILWIRRKQRVRGAQWLEGFSGNNVSVKQSTTTLGGSRGLDCTHAA